MDSKTISEIRELSPNELPQLNQLVSESFGYEAPHTFFEDFPIWNSKAVKHFGIFSDQKLISHVGIRFCDLKSITGTLIPIAMVGAVATDESFRGKGLSTRLLNEVCKISDQHGCVWTLLWGSEHEFYKKFGFTLQGEQFQAPLASLDDLPENKIPRVKRGWNPEVFKFLSTTITGVKLNEDDRDWVSMHQTVNWFYQEEPFAFAAFERGLDLPNMVHEFGGDPQALKEILAYLLSLDFSATILGTKETLIGLGFSESDCVEEYLCLARPNPSLKELRWQPDYWVSGLSAC